MSGLELPGELAARYRVLRQLGEGGYGRVLLAEELGQGRRVALKVLHPGLQEAEIHRRFLQEARVTAQLRHPNVVEVLDAGEAGGTAFIAYAYVDGPTLARVADRPEPPAPASLRLWGQAIAGALREVHEAGVVHRDVKPENVLLRGGDHPVLVDFGVARLEGGVRTATGVLLGTPPFMAPEVWLGEVPGPAADQFAWAATLWTLLTGDFPYATDVPGEIIRLVSRGWEPPRQARLGDPGLEAVLVRALAADPAARFPDMGAMARALEATPAQGWDLAGARTGRRAAGVDRNQTTLVSEEAPRVEARAAAPARRGATGGLAALLLLGLVALGWGTSRPAPAPGPPAGSGALVRASPLEDPAVAARTEACEQSLGPVLRHYAPEELDFGFRPTDEGRAAAALGRIEELRERQFGLDFEQLAMDLERWLRALRAWEEAEPGRPSVWEVPAIRGLFRRLVRDGFAVVADEQRTIRDQGLHLPGTPAYHGEFARHAAMTQNPWDGMKPYIERVAAALEAWAPGAPDEVLAVACLLRGLTQSEDFRASLGPALARVRGAEPPGPGRPHLWLALGSTLSRVVGGEALPCPERQEAFFDLMADARRHRDAVPPRDWLNAVGGFTGNRVAYMRRCTEPLGPRALAEIEAVVGELEAGRRRFPQVVRGRASAFLGGTEEYAFLGDPDPALVRVRERLRALLDELGAAPG